MSGVVVVAGLSAVALHGATDGRDQAAASAGESVRESATTSVPTTRTTIPPGPTPVMPRSADERGAAFATGPSVSILLVARERCWVGVNGGDGTQDFQVMLQPGQQQRIDSAAPVVVRLGNPTAVDVFVAGAPAQVPARPGHPFDLTFTTA